MWLTSWGGFCTSGSPGGPGEHRLTTRIAFYLAALLIAFGLGDAVLNGGDSLLFLAKKFIALMDWVEFWR